MPLRWCYFICFFFFFSLISLSCISFFISHFDKRLYDSLWYLAPFLIFLCFADTSFLPLFDILQIFRRHISSFESRHDYIILSLMFAPFYIFHWLCIPWSFSSTDCPLSYSRLLMMFHMMPFSPRLSFQLFLFFLISGLLLALFHIDR